MENTVALSVKNYAKLIKRDVLAAAAKCKVRECDEIEKGKYVAYVDEGNDSYDTCLTVGADGKVSGHTCECANAGTMCSHQVALLVHVAEGKKLKAVIKTGKKKAGMEALLEEADTAELKEWVRGVLQKNKDLQLSFVHHFSSAGRQYTPADVAKLVNDAIKAAAGNKKNVDTTQLKKVAELWADMLGPVIKQYLGNVSDAAAFMNIQTIADLCLYFHNKISTSSNKVTKFVEDMLQQAGMHITALQNEPAWDAAVKLLTDNVYDSQPRVRMHYVLLLKDMALNGEAERRKRIVRALAAQYKANADVPAIQATTAFTKAVLELVDEEGLFSEYHKLFKPIRFDNEFNEHLIQLQIDNGHLQLAEQSCLRQMQLNYREEYNVPYLQLLREIYRLQKDEQKEAGVMMQLFPYSFDFDDYLSISVRMPPDEQKTWRTKIQLRASNASSSGNSAATTFIFRLADHERKHKKMLDYIRDSTPWELLITYFEPMARAGKEDFLRQLLKKESYKQYTGNSDKIQLIFSQLFDLLLKFYTGHTLRIFIVKLESERSFYRATPFHTYVAGRLKELKQE